jgi:subtilisin family serine protease
MKIRTKISALLCPAIMVALAFLPFQSAFTDEPFSSVDSLDMRHLNWYNLDPLADSVQGASVDKTYREILNTLTPKRKVVVAVIDGGVDINHHELEGKIWTNPGEIPDNGIDDDRNGYVDDIHGWNFLGNRAGENIQFENYEYVRIYKKYDAVFRNVKSIREIPADEKTNYRVYLASRKKYRTERKKNETEKTYIDFFENSYNKAEKTLKLYLHKDSIVLADVAAVSGSEDSIAKARDFLAYVFNNGLTPPALKEFKQYNRDLLEKKLNPDQDFRAILADDPTNIQDTDYGNNDVKGPSSDHGTFVSGIIAASRENGDGINGIAGNAEIMVLRAVPDGDEYDKDIALAIRYAVDNGANIINMSFGKSFSPQKKFVDEALHYADGKNVLIIHSAGNEAYNIDKTIQYPSKSLNDGAVAANYITVGATTSTLDPYFVADFSNYGRKNVDLFAPGVDIISLYPNDKFNLASGTSFSGPVVTGVAALIWSYYPELIASEVKDILLQSVSPVKNQKVYYPTDENKPKKKTKFKRLSITGGIVNAYNAMQLAEKIVKQKAGV